jgi:hypothetical protein
LRVLTSEGTLEFLESINKYGEREIRNYPYYWGHGIRFICVIAMLIILKI